MLDGIPDQLRAGDTWKWRTSSADYSAADGWVLTTAFRGTESLDVEGVADGGGWISTGAAADTADLPAGRYSWISRASKDGETYTVGSGVVEVLPDLTASEEPYDGRTDAEKQLAAVETCLTTLLSKQHSSSSFGDQSYTLQDIEKLKRIRDQLRSQVAAEKRASNGGKGRRILIEFGGL
ncbi:hypothetical protein OKA05_02015 [Luteolibacter arcticus]|uniref:Uncharacterized protein n=1 Tax=Luteolibacter arcticus TaxID=1581411 RepID=A0ABT3GCE9_9BACT|nr:hypothetical protein [Luteolibacter arcticus]MCW1921308.1 hypothetical protein [Luteolibacter arcticus]